jgi:hypothetical protein
MKNVLIALFSLFLILISSLLIFRYFHPESLSLTGFVEKAIEARTGKEVEIGSISFVKGPSVVLRRAVIKEAETGRLFARLPEVGIKVSLSSLLNLRVQEIQLNRPELFLLLEGDPRRDDDRSGISPARYINQISVNNGQVMLEVEEEKSFRISSVTLSMKRKGDTAAVSGTLFVAELNVTVPVDMTLDAEELELKKGRLNITLNDIGNLPFKNLSFAGDKEIQGRANLVIDLYRQEMLEARIHGRLHDINITDKTGLSLVKHISGEAEILLKADRGYEVVSIEGTGNLGTHINGEETVHSLSFLGRYDLIGDALKIQDASFVSPLFGSIIMEGVITGLSSRDPHTHLNLEGKEIDVNEMKSAFPGVTPPMLSTVGIHGDGSISLSITGSLKSPQIKGALDMTGRWIKREPFQLNSYRILLPFEYESGRLRFVNGSLQSDRATIIMNGEYKGKIEQIELLVGNVEYGGSHIRAGDLLVRADRIIMEINGDTFSTEDGITLHASLGITVPENKVSRIKGKADMLMTGGTFYSSDGSTACEGLSLKSAGNFQFDVPLHEAEFSLDAEATKFELLKGMFYGSFKDRILSAALEGKYSGTEDSLRLSRADIRLTGIGKLGMSGQIKGLTSSPHFDARVDLVQLSMDDTFRFFVRETFQESLPMLSQLNMGGKASMTARVIGSPDKLQVNGELEAVDMYILDENSGLSVEGITISLPIHISYPEAGDNRETGRFGSAHVDAILWDEVQIKDLLLFPVIRNNNLLFKEDITIPAFGGEIRLEDIRYNNLLSSKRDLRLSARINSLDLQAVGRALGIPPFSGSLSGSIPEARISRDSLSTEGEMIVKLFEGEVKVIDLSIHNIFSPITSLRTSVEIEEIDLNGLTDTFKFGNISGTLRGFIKDLVITNGQAESFDVHMETVESPKVDQWISVEALKKISVLGGSPTSVLNTGIYRLFNKYRYEKIGFRGSLRNDNFLILGIFSEGDRHYLVKGGALPPKVDVINYTRNVSFREMIGRLKRIQEVQR